MNSRLPQAVLESSGAESGAGGASGPKVALAIAGYLVVLLAGLLLLAPRLGGDSLEGDELLYASVAHDTRQQGRWFPFEVDGGAYLQKPIGGFILLRGAMAVLGESEAALRWPSVLAGLATALTLFRFGSRWFGLVPGLVSALGFLSLEVVRSRHALRGATFDSATTFLITLSLSLWLDDLRAGTNRRLPAIAAGIGLSTLFKNLAGPSLAAAAMAAGELLQSRSGRTPGARPRWRVVLVPLALAVAVFGGWMAILGSTRQLEMSWVVERLVLRDIVQRGLEGVRPDHVLSPPLYFFEQVGRELGPVLLLLVPFWLSAIRARPREELGGSRFELALGAWPVGMLLALSCFRSKLPWYSLPVYPGLALCVGGGIAEILRRSKEERRRLIQAAFLLLTGAATFRSGLTSDRSATVHPLSALERLAQRGAAQLFVERRLEVAARTDLAAYYYLGRVRAIATEVDRLPGVVKGCSAAVVESSSAAELERIEGMPPFWRRTPLPTAPSGRDWEILDGCSGAIAEELAAVVRESAESRPEPRRESQ